MKLYSRACEEVTEAVFPDAGDMEGCTFDDRGLGFTVPDFCRLVRWVLANPAEAVALGGVLEKLREEITDE
jgi:hypothetical protein